MLNRKTYLESHPDLTEGMPVKSMDGEKLGKITMLSDDSFVVEKGFFFPKDFSARYDDIQNISNGEVILNQEKSALSEWRNESYQGWSNIDEINRGKMNVEPLAEYRDRYKDRFGYKEGEQATRARTTSEQVNVPLAEEELQAQKNIRQAGEVTVRKVVHTELKHFTVPVTREEVHIERTPITEGRPAEAAEAGQAFQEKTVKVPIMEEEVTVSKRPVVKEEMRLTKERRTEEKEVAGEVRKEEAEIEQPEISKRRKAG